MVLVSLLDDTDSDMSGSSVSLTTQSQAWRWHYHEVKNVFSKSVKFNEKISEIFRHYFFMIQVIYIKDIFAHGFQEIFRRFLGGPDWLV